jgi:RNA polymerase sigma factor (sigma-70 family)
VKLIVQRIAGGDQAAVEELYEILLHKLRPQFYFRVGEHEADDLLHETLAIVIKSIQSKLIRDPDAIVAFSQTVARRLVAAWIIAAIRSRKRLVSIDLAGHMQVYEDSPETMLLDQERSELLEEGLRMLGTRDSELLTRFYVLGQPIQQVCADMGLTENQFRLFKSRAKAKLAAWARRRD